MVLYNFVTDAFVLLAVVQVFPRRVRADLVSTLHLSQEDGGGTEVAAPGGIKRSQSLL